MNELLNKTQFRILLVEDDHEHLERCNRWLTRFGYQKISMARTVDEAKAQLQKHFDIIVTDMRMETDDSGFEILEEVNRRNISSVVIILTANDTVEDCRRAFKSKVWDYIQKNAEENPFEILHNSIQEAKAYLSRWGNTKDEAWINQNMGYLRSKYPNKYIAVLNNSVLEVANTLEELKLQVSERKLPLFITVIKKIELPTSSDRLIFGVEGPLLNLPVLGPLSSKLTVFVEGPTDVAYIKKATTLLGYEKLLDDVHLDTIGDETGQKGSGHTNLGHGFSFLKNNPGLRPNKVMFLCDQDVKDNKLPNKGQDFDNLYIRRIGNDYSPEDKGIEWLFEENIFEEGFFKGFIAKDLGRATVTQPQPKPTYIVQEKTKFCNWICHERANTPADFQQFQIIFEIIEQVLAS
ncbi:response regulator [Anaerolineales bacterium HSG6]|nr:response regulator [Anaerolineales bacterium HSG6]